MGCPPPLFLATAYLLRVTVKDNKRFKKCSVWPEKQPVQKAADNADKLRVDEGPAIAKEGSVVKENSIGRYEL